MNKNFISYPGDCGKSSSLLLRRTFCLKRKKGRYVLSVSGLGMAVYYLNGKRINDHVLVTAVSDYRKTLWVDEEDVTDLLKEGKNVFAVQLGNGFYNEGFETPWHFEKAPWRAEKCLNMELKENDKVILSSDESFRVALCPWMLYNELRSGEHIDANQYFSFEAEDFDDTSWENAVLLKKQPLGEFRKLECPPIRETEEYAPVRTLHNPDGVVYDFGHNLSGYCSLTVSAPKGTKVTLRFAEDVNPDGTLQFNHADIYQKEPFQTDWIIASGKPFSYRPLFTYHGFRYVEVTGLTDPGKTDIRAHFVHQDLNRLSSFSSDNETLNRLYEAGIRSFLSNTYYCMTDCPTREKLGWLNDASASYGQVMTNFDCREFLRKWMRDILDAQREDGCMPGIAPSPDWGYDFGIICGVALFNLPYLYNKYYHDDFLLKESVPAMERYLDFLLQEKNPAGLGDWTGNDDHAGVPAAFVRHAFFLFMMQVLSDCHSSKKDHYAAMIQEERENFSREYLTEEGGAVYPSQTGISVLLHFGLGNRDLLKKELHETIEKSGYHLDCGMVGLQFLYPALFENGLADDYYRIVLNETAPSFRNWIDQGADTLWETFRENPWTNSKNHHMYSGVILPLTEYAAGITPGKRSGQYLVRPVYSDYLKKVTCTESVPGKEGDSVTVSYEIKKDFIFLDIIVKGGATAVYEEKEYGEGHHSFRLEK